MNDSNRREFLKFIGVSSIGLATFPLLKGCSQLPLISNKGTFPTNEDELILRQGLNYQTLISWGDHINNSEIFGFNNDYISFYELSPTELILWVNHEYVNPLFVSGKERTKKNVDIEKSLVGGSLIHIRKKNNWNLVESSKYNKGIRGNTKIPIAYNMNIKGTTLIEGTLANCAGGKTPWGTILTCEENFDNSYGDRKKDQKEVDTKNSYLHWEKYYPKNIPEHYGWVVEVDPLTGNAQKHMNIGRFSHECATCVQTKKGNVVVYSGDDHNDEHLYKFVSNHSDSFKTGTLYVAKIENGKGLWLPLDIKKSSKLKKEFKSQNDVLIYTREAAKVLGATPLNRPEDIEIHPHTGHIFIALTNNKGKGDMHGTILKISEDQSDYAALSFSAETYLLGGKTSGFSCPDNLAFDKKGNLWFTTDISGSALNKGVYKTFGNNGLFVVPTSGPDAGKAIQIASAPIEAEFTGPCFSPDQKTLFLSVQHPGERSQSLENLTSHWPTGNIPKPSVVCINGPLLDQLTQG